VRKRLALIFLGIAIISLAAYILAQPKPGTIAYHKREYVKARNTLEGNTLRGRFARLLHRTTGVWIDYLSAKADKGLRQQLEKHEEVLLGSGYLVEHQFVITNNYDATLLNLVTNQSGLLPEEKAQYTRITRTGAPLLYVVGRPSDLPKWEEVIRKLDVPQKPAER
jgi:hypothetical protein